MAPTEIALTQPHIVTLAEVIGLASRIWDRFEPHPDAVSADFVAELYARLLGFSACSYPGDQRDLSDVEARVASHIVDVLLQQPQLLLPQHLLLPIGDLVELRNVLGVRTEGGIRLTVEGEPWRLRFLTERDRAMVGSIHWEFQPQRFAANMLFLPQSVYLDERTFNLVRAPIEEEMPRTDTGHKADTYIGITVVPREVGTRLAARLRQIAAAVRSMPDPSPPVDDYLPQIHEVPLEHRPALVAFLGTLADWIDETLERSDVFSIVGL